LEFHSRLREDDEMATKDDRNTEETVDNHRPSIAYRSRIYIPWNMTKVSVEENMPLSGTFEPVFQ